MRKILIDTNAYSAFKQDDQRIIEVLKNVDFIGMDITVYAELISGFKSGKKEVRNRKELEAFLNNPRVHILKHDLETAEFYSEVYLHLRTVGKAIPTNDLWIAATALQNGLAVLTLDKHFNFIPNLLTIKIQA